MATATTTDLARRTRARITRRLMPYLFILYLFAYIDRINVGFAGLQMTRELGFSDAVFGLGSGIFFLGYTLLGVPGAILVDRWSARKMVTATMLGWGVAAAITGLIHTSSEFYSARFVLGLTEAGFFPGIITYLHQWYTAKDRARAVALFMTSVPMAQVVASPLSAYLMHVNWMGLAGWRWLLILEGVPAVFLGVITFFYLTDRPDDAHWLEPEERAWINDELARERDASKGAKSTIWSALSHPVVLLLSLSYFGATASGYGITLWMPKILQSVGKLDDFWTSMLTAIPAIVSVPVMILVGGHSDHTGERRWHTATPRMIGGLALALMATVTLSLNATTGLILFSLGLAGVLAGYAPLWGIPSQYLSSTAAAASVGLISSLGNLGGFAGPYLVGYFSQKTGGYSGGLWTTAVSMFVSGAIVLILRKRNKPDA